MRTRPRRNGTFLGSPPPMKKWHLSAQAPHLSQISINSLKERYFLSRSPLVSRNISFQFSGIFQSSSVGFQSLALGKSTYFKLLAFAPQQKMPGLISVLVSIHPFEGGV